MYRYFVLVDKKRSDVFARRTSTGSDPFSLLIYLNATKFVFLNVFTPIETILPKIRSESRLKSAKRQLSVDVRGSNTLVLKLMVVAA